MLPNSCTTAKQRLSTRERQAASDSCYAADAVQHSVVSDFQQHLLHMQHTHIVPSGACYCLQEPWQLLLLAFAAPVLSVIDAQQTRSHSYVSMAAPSQAQHQNHQISSVPSQSPASCLLKGGKAAATCCAAGVYWQCCCERLGKPHLAVGNVLRGLAERPKHLFRLRAVIRRLRADCCQLVLCCTAVQAGQPSAAGHAPELYTAAHTSPRSEAVALVWRPWR